MQSRSYFVWFLVLACCLIAAIPGQAAPPWLSLFSFGSGETPKQTIQPEALELTEREGPWLIMATSFSGPTANKQATDLVVELREKFDLPAYIHRLHFDYTQTVGGLGVDRYGNPRKFKHLNGQEYDQLAVMVGNFNSVEDPNAQRALEVIKSAKPACMDSSTGKVSQDKLKDFWYMRTKIQQVVKSRGPMGNAFITRNPLLPEEMFVSKGLDPFVVEMNQDLEYSLLKNKSKFTVRIASFRGVDTLSPKKFEELTTKRREVPKIEQAANNAHELTLHLRSQGYEAYEFHDTTESIVCVGGFKEVGTPRADGKMEINPAVLRVMQEFGPKQQPIPGQSGTQLQPRIIKSMPLDYQPIPVEVPRSSLAAQYAPTAMKR